MIHYQSRTFFLNVVHNDGSTFPKAACVALPGCFITFFLIYFEYYSDQDKAAFGDSSIWGGFNFLAGFLVVFRTQQAYQRFSRGAHTWNAMGICWFHSASQLMAYLRMQPEEHPESLEFQNVLLRLFSLLHAVAVADVEEHVDDDGIPFDGLVIDPNSLDERSLKTLRESVDKVELVYQWIQCLVVDNIKNKLLIIPPPILMRAFEELENGMCYFRDALRIATVQFPFPYAQTCDLVLILHWVISPFVTAAFVSQTGWACMFTFIQVFTLWNLNSIGVELENPFGSDPNDLEGVCQQQTFNAQLRLLVLPSTNVVPVMDCSDSELDDCYARAVDESHDACYKSVMAQEDTETHEVHYVHRMHAEPTVRSMPVADAACRSTDSLTKHASSLKSGSQAAPRTPSSAFSTAKAIFSRASTRSPLPQNPELKLEPVSQELADDTDADFGGSARSPPELVPVVLGME